VSRFSEPQDPVFQRMNASLAFDRRLWPQDIAQSRAHATMLAAQGIISDSDRDELLAGLDAVERELAGGTFPFAPDDEDIHMAVERRLIEIAGPVGGKLHTARSRNDQVATDVSLFTREAALDAVAKTEALMVALVDAAERHADWPLPGYTHLQRAQPVYLAHHLLAYVWMLDRDFVLDYLNAAAVCTMHLSRLGAELVIWSSQEFGFVDLPDAWSSGSSIMPQKKNPDAAELLRAKAPRVSGRLSALLGVMHALPLTYNKDMQEDKEHLFDAVDTVGVALDAARGMVSGARFNRERMAAAASDDLIAATDIADLLVRRGVPFRECHGIVAGLVRTAVESGRGLGELTEDELQTASPHLDGEVRDVLAQRSWLESKVSEGGTSSARVAEQLAAARALLT
jgi:argininosuccinate lyase